MNYINYLNSLSFSKVDTIFSVYKRGEGTFRGKGQYLWKQGTGFPLVGEESFTEGAAPFFASKNV